MTMGEFGRDGLPRDRCRLRVRDDKTQHGRGAARPYQMKFLRFIESSEHR
jgi:hypothetical protein